MKTIKIIYLVIYMISWGVFTNKSQSQWFSLSSGTGMQLESVFFLNSSSGYYTGEGQIIRRTTNGGVNWEIVQNPNTGLWNHCIHFTSSGTGFTCGSTPGSGGDIKRSPGGSAWNTVYTGSGTIYDIYSLYFPDPMTGYAVGVNQTILKTTNSGLNWFLTSSIGTSALRTVFFTDVLTGYAAGHNGAIMKTTNGGVNWITQGSSSYTYYSIVFVNSSTGYVTGSNGLIMKTVDGGSLWSTQTSGFLYDLNSVFFTSPEVGYVVGAAGKILKTINGGSVWTSQSTGTGSFLKSVFFLDANTGFAVGTSGVILKTTNGGGDPVGIQPITAGIPEDFALYQNYPNPFNPSTKIRFQITGLNFTTLRIYDAAGRELETLISEILNPGTYELGWDASIFTSGIYFYKLQAGEFLETRKMILIK